MNNTISMFCKRAIHSLGRTWKSSNIPESGVLQPIEVKKSMVQNLVQYWKSVYRDYKTVSFDVLSEMKTHPRKAFLKLIALGFLGYCAYDNPSKEHYYNELLNNHLRLVLVPSSIRNITSEEYISMLESYNNLKCLQHQSFGIFSVIYTEDYSRTLEVYKKQCNYLHPSYLNYLREKIVDVGFFNYWYNMNKLMTDYDINDKEWKDQAITS